MATALDDTNAICSARQLAEVLALTVRQVHHLQTEGILRKARGKQQGYKLADSVQSYLRYQHDYAKRKYSSNGDAAYSDARSRRMAALAIVEETRARQLVMQRDPHKVRSILDTAVRNCLIEVSKFGAQSFDETRKNGVRDDDA